MNCRNKSVRRSTDEGTGNEGMGYTYKEGELTLWSFGVFRSQEVNAMYEHLRELRGEAPTVKWKPGWRCECGNTTSIWFAPEGRKTYSISCEDCWASIG